MHFFVHASESALAPLTPHFESLTQPFTVWASLANDTEATNKTSAPASNNESSFRMSSSLDWFPHLMRSLHFITGSVQAGLRKIGKLRPSTGIYLSFLLTFVPGAPGGWLLRRIGSNVNNFSPAGVVELLARFLLDGSRIGFQRFDLVDVLIVFLLQTLDLTLERLHLGALL